MRPSTALLTIYRMDILKHTASGTIVRMHDATYPSHSCLCYLYPAKPRHNLPP